MLELPPTKRARRPAPSADLTKLPDDLVGRVLSRLNVFDLAVAAGVCRSWRCATHALRCSARSDGQEGLPRHLSGWERPRARAEAARGDRGLRLDRPRQILARAMRPVDMAEARDMWSSGHHTPLLWPTLLDWDCAGRHLFVSNPNYSQEMRAFDLADGREKSAASGLVADLQVPGPAYVFAHFDDGGGMQVPWGRPGDGQTARFSSSTGEHLAVAEGGIATVAWRLFATRDGRELCRLSSDMPGALPIWDASGRVVASRMRDGRLHAFDLVTERRATLAPPREQSIDQVLLNRGGALVLFVGTDRGVDCMDLWDGDPRRRVVADPMQAFPPRDGHWQWSPDGAHASGIIENFWARPMCKIRVVALPSNQISLEIPVPVDSLWICAWSPDSRKLAVAPRNLEDSARLLNLRIYEVAGGTLLTTLSDLALPAPLPLRSYHQLAWSPTGAHLAFSFSLGAFGLVTFDADQIELEAAPPAAA